MTPARFLIILVVVVLVLFGVSLALQKRNGNARGTKPTNSWVNSFNKSFEERQKLNPEKDLTSTCRNGNKLVIPKMLMQCTVTVRTNEDRAVRKAELSLGGADKFSLEYKPLDKGAVALKIDEINPGKSIKLVFQKSGGTLTLARKGVTGDALVTIN